MKRYESPRPRLALGVAALMMTASTFGVLVVLPSQAELSGQAWATTGADSSATANARATETVTCKAST